MLMCVMDKYNKKSICVASEYVCIICLPACTDEGNAYII